MLIRDAKKGVASNGKPFLTLYFADATGEIDAKLWDVSKEDEAIFVAEKVVKVIGDINEFRGAAQMRIKSIRPARVKDGVKISDFLQRAPIEKEELKAQIMECVFEMKNPNIQRIVRAFIGKYNEELFVYPADRKSTRL